MTRAEAILAGHLAKAYRATDELLDGLGNHGDEDLMGLSCSVDHSDSGCSGFGPYIMLPPDMIEEVIGRLRDLLVTRLTALGVEP